MKVCTSMQRIESLREREREQRFRDNGICGELLWENSWRKGVDESIKSKDFFFVSDLVGLKRWFRQDCEMKCRV